MVSGVVFHSAMAELAETAATATTNNRPNWRTSADRQEAMLERSICNGAIIAVLSSAKTIFVTIIPAMLPVTYGDYGPPGSQARSPSPSPLRTQRASFPRTALKHD